MSLISSLPRRWSRAPIALAAFLVLVTPSCKLFSATVNAPGNIASSVLGGKKPPEKLPPNILQGGLMRFADTFAARVTQATQDFADRAATPEARIQAMGWAIRQNTSAFTIASGPNPNVALLDMVVLVTLSRMVHEEHILPNVWGEADRPMVEAFQSLERDIWEVAAQTLTQPQQDELRATLRAWRDENPNMAATSFVRLPAFQDIIKARADAAEAKANTGTGLGDLLSVDPLSGLEPAVREIEKSRLFAERTLYYAQRAPILLSTQVELLGMKLARMAEVHSALDYSQRISLAAASLAETAAKLPESVRVEREAAVKQISDELSLQRQGIVADLEKSEAPARKILTDARATLEAGAQMSIALQGTIGSLDNFIGGFAAKEPPPGAPPPPPAEPSKPFDITEYGDTATKIGVMAHELNGVVASLDQSLPNVQRTMDEAARRGDQTIDHAFVRGIELGAILIALAAIAALGVRKFSARSVASATPR
ncbi:MAG TPA: hypothetical protein VGR31_11345 [Planctomycetota bacterium]|jgi:hypothetical protein|nr:hypothetical protein [Planctomycetota bacterium]